MTVTGKGDAPFLGLAAGKVRRAPMVKFRAPLRDGRRGESRVAADAAGRGQGEVRALSTRRR